MTAMLWFVAGVWVGIGSVVLGYEFSAWRRRAA